MLPIAAVSMANNLTFVVDGNGFFENPGGSPRDDCVEVDGLAFFPEKGEVVSPVKLGDVQGDGYRFAIGDPIQPPVKTS